ncbi:MAG: hypothetical protein M1827_004386 [Pycnora praestabilis]|nr:MAG: hypothetical protein M1827_004386 [Pycnora praestabilis]
MAIEGNNGVSGQDTKRSLYATIRLVGILNEFKHKLQARIHANRQRRLSPAAFDLQEAFEDRAYSALENFSAPRKTHCVCSKRQSNVLVHERQSHYDAYLEELDENVRFSPAPLSKLAANDSLFLNWRADIQVYLANTAYTVDVVTTFLDEVRQRRSSICDGDDFALDYIHDLKFLANLEHLLLCLQHKLIQTLFGTVKEILQLYVDGLREDRQRKKRLGFGRFAEWPSGRRPLSTTWPWNIKPSLVVLWGVCWMFVYNNDQGRRLPARMNRQRALESQSFWDYSSPAQVFQPLYYESNDLTPSITALGGNGHARTQSPPQLTIQTNYGGESSIAQPLEPRHESIIDNFVPQGSFSPRQYSSTGSHASPISYHSSPVSGWPSVQATSYHQFPGSQSNTINPQRPPNDHLMIPSHQYGPPPLVTTQSPNAVHPNFSSALYTPNTIDNHQVQGFFPVKNSPAASPMIDTSTYPSPVPSTSGAGRALSRANSTSISSPSEVIMMANPESPTPATSDRRRHSVRRGGDPPKNDENKIICDHQDCANNPPTFGRKCEWSKHMDKHERPYVCKEPSCEKLPGFTYSGGLLRHQREVHKKNEDGKKRLMCPHHDCKRSSGDGFTRKENLNEHLRRVHQIPDKQCDVSTGDSPSPIGEDVSSRQRKRKRSAIWESSCSTDDGRGDERGQDLRAEIKRLKKENEEKGRRLERLEEFCRRLEKKER